MKAFIIKTNTIIQPFDEDVSLSMIVNETLAENQNRVLKNSGFTPELVDSLDKISKSGEETILLLTDKVYISEKLVSSFMEASKGMDEKIF